MPDRWAELNVEVPDKLKTTTNRVSEIGEDFMQLAQVHDMQNIRPIANQIRSKVI